MNGKATIHQECDREVWRKCPEAWRSRHTSAGRWSLRISSIYLYIAQAGSPLVNSQLEGKKRRERRRRGENWSVQFGMPFPACEDGARSFKGHTSKNLHRSGTLCTLISLEKTSTATRKRKRKKGEGEESSQIDTRQHKTGGCRNQVPVLSPLTHQPPRPAAYSHTA